MHVHARIHACPPTHTLRLLFCDALTCFCLLSASDGHTHKPTLIQIGNGDQKAQITKPRPQKQAPPPSHHGKNSDSTTNGSGSPDSVTSGGKFQYDAPLSSASSAEPFSTSAVSSTSDLHISPAHHMVPQPERKVSQPQEDLAEINRYVWVWQVGGA